MDDKEKYQIQKLWRKAQPAELMGMGDPVTMEIFGTLVIAADTPHILTRLPREDYEIGDADIRQFKIMYAHGNDGMMADYFKFLQELDPYILDEQYNSALVRPMSHEEISAVFEKIGFTPMSKTPPAGVTEEDVQAIRDVDFGI